MSPLLAAILLVPGFILVAGMFGRSALTGLRTGAIYTKGTRYERARNPILFWISFGFSVAFAMFSVAAIALLGWAVLSFS